MDARVYPLKENATHGTLSFPCAAYLEKFTDYTNPAPFNCKHHWHEELEIIYFEQGQFHVEIGMDKFDINQPCLCFVRSAELHAMYCNSDYSESAIVFSPSMFSFVSQDAAQNEYLKPLIENELFPPRLIYHNHPYFYSILYSYQNIIRILDPHSSDYHNSRFPSPHLSAAEQLSIKASLLSIIGFLAQGNLLTSEPIISDQRIEVIKESISYIKTHYQEKIYISKLASLANMNEQYYCRFFKKIIGKTPVQYLNELRIQKSMLLLRNTASSVLDISLECGFNNLGNYMKFFKQQTGTTPLQYRKINQKFH